MAERYTIVGLGEALFDIFPQRQVLGGAPLNVAVHAQQMLAGRQGRGVVVSRVGQDELGDQVRAELRARQMTDEYVQADPDHPTGQVYVSVDAHGQPSYEIVENSAWDWLQFDPDLETLARRCDAVCFGSLAQRHAQTRNTIYRFVGSTRPNCLRMFDVNLRQQYYDAQTLTRSAELANVLKLNRDELPQVARLLMVGTVARDARLDPAQEIALAQQLRQQLNLKLVVLTRGEQGTLLVPGEAAVTGTPASYPQAEGADAVGAGDACSAAVLAGLVLRLPLQQVADLANLAGAYVASVPGATPTLPADLLQRFSA